MIKDLKEKAPEGYNLAAIVPLDHDLNDLANINWMPVLKVCKGALGVLRGLDQGRLQGIQRAFADDGQTHRVLYLEFIEGAAVLSDYKFTVHRD